MELILLKRVENLGSLGDRVVVKPGFGRNYLIPTGRAIPATTENVKAFEERRSGLEREAITLLADSEVRRDKLIGYRLTVARRAGDEGRLFGSVTSADIAAALQAAGHSVNKHEVRLPVPLRIIGEHSVTLHLHTGVDTVITVEIIAEV